MVVDADKNSMTGCLLLPGVAFRAVADVVFAAVGFGVWAAVLVVGSAEVLHFLMYV